MSSRPPAPPSATSRSSPWTGSPSAAARIDGSGTNHVIEGGLTVNGAKNVRVTDARITNIPNAFGGVRHAETAGFVVRDCKFTSAAGATTAIGVSINSACSRGRVAPRGNDYADLAGAGIGGIGGLGVLLDTTFDVHDFGAKGDGVTDDQVAFANAMTFCAANGGGDVLVPASTSNYMIGAVVQLRSNVRVLLGGNLKALPPFQAVAMLESVNRNNIVVEGLPGGGIIDLNRANTPSMGSAAQQIGVYLLSNIASPTVNLTVRRLTVINGWSKGIAITGSVPGGLTSNVVIEDNTVTDMGDVGIYVAGVGNADKVTASPSQDILIRRNNVSFPTVAGMGAIQVNGCSHVRVRDNILDGGGLARNHGITMGSSGATSFCTDFTVDGNRISRFTLASMWGICLTMNATRFVVSNNQVVGCTGGITVDLADTVAPTAMINAQGLVEGNTCLNSTASHGINTNCANGLTYSNNRCIGGAGASSGGIYVSQSANVTVVGNTCMNNTARGIAVFGANAGTGLHEISGNLARLATPQATTTSTPLCRSPAAATSPWPGHPPSTPGRAPPTGAPTAPPGPRSTSRRPPPPLPCGPPNDPPEFPVETFDD